MENFLRAKLEIRKKIIYDEDKVSGRRVLAGEKIEKDEIIFSIPVNGGFFVPPQNICGSFKNVPLHSSSEMIALIVSMMIDRRNVHSEWKPYWDWLPFGTLSVPLLWDEADRRKLPFHEELEEQLTVLRSDFENVVEPFFAQQQKDVHISLKEFLEVGCVVIAYSFQVFNNYAMVPLADYLNHDYYRNNARLFTNATSLDMIAVKNIAQGAEIFNTYGKRDNVTLLQRYGYVDASFQFRISSHILHSFHFIRHNDHVVTQKIGFSIKKNLPSWVFRYAARHIFDEVEMRAVLQLFEAIHFEIPGSTVLSQLRFFFNPMLSFSKHSYPFLERKFFVLILHFLKPYLEIYNHSIHFIASATMDESCTKEYQIAVATRDFYYPFAFWYSKLYWLYFVLLTK